jgi:putative addiction module component (TIGR02574 family)
MANTPLHKLRSDALELPDQQRAELAHDLIASLDGRPDPGGATAWDDELVRRAEALEAGHAAALDRVEFSKRMRERLSRL